MDFDFSVLKDDCMIVTPSWECLRELENALIKDGWMVWPSRPALEKFHGIVIYSVDKKCYGLVNTLLWTQYIMDFKDKILRFSDVVDEKLPAVDLNKFLE